MTNYAGLISEKNIPQSEPLNERQVKNNQGGYVFTVSIWQRLERFLILGSDGGTFYQTAQKLTRENAAIVEQCWKEDPAQTAAILMNIANANRAPRQDPSIFAMALGAISESADARAWAKAPMVILAVCRTGTHLFMFVRMLKDLGGGFGRGTRKMVCGWYESKSVEQLAYQLIKYRQRYDLTHENVLDMARPKTEDRERNAVYAWAVGKPKAEGVALPALIVSREAIKDMQPADKADLLNVVRSQKGLPWEALPTWANNDPDIQGALLPGMGLTAIIRNLGNFTRIGLIKPMSTAEGIIVNRLSIDDEIKRSRVHPMQILVALKVYAAGRSMQHGSKDPSTWVPNQKILDALNEAFYKAFQNVEPTGKRHFIAIDVSGSMSAAISGSPAVTCAEAAAALALVTYKTEQKSVITRFNNGLEQLGMGAMNRLDDVLRYTQNINTGGTDCSLPMVVARQQGIEADVFVVITDNETRHGRMHPMAALREYRKATGINAKLVVIAMTPTNFTIADPLDSGALDVVGFDAGSPAVIADFVRN